MLKKDVTCGLGFLLLAMIASLALCDEVGKKPHDKLEDLITKLRSSNFHAREDAAFELGKLGDARAVEPLIVCLKDRRFEVRWNAVEALGDLGDARAVEPLIACLKDKDVQEDAGRALGKLGKPAVLPLIGCLKDSDPSVRRFAAEGLGLLGDARAIKPLIACLKHQHWQVRDYASFALRKLGYQPENVDDEGAYLVAQQKWDEVGKLGAAGVDLLIACLKDQYGDVRGHAAFTLGKLGDKKAVAPLLACLNDQDLGVRRSASEALGDLGLPALEALIACLEDEDPIVRLNGAKALGKLGDARAVEPLIACLKYQVRYRPDPFISSYPRQEAARALSKLGDARAVEPLIACFKDSDVVVRLGATDALGKLGKPAFEPLIRCLKHQDSEVRGPAARALGKLGDKRAVEPLIPCLKDRDSGVRLSAVEALDKLGARIVEPLVPCLKDPDGEVRWAAANALGKLGDMRAVEPLIACFKDRRLFRRLAAAEMLGRLGDKRAVEPLCAALPDWKANQTVGSALEELGWQPTSDVEKAYYWICRKDGKSLKQHWEKIKEVLLADMKSGSPRKIENALYTFLSLGKEEVVPELIRILDAQPNKEIADMYLRCTHTGLTKAGRDWLSRHAYKVPIGQPSQRVLWGRW